MFLVLVVFGCSTEDKQNESGEINNSEVNNMSNVVVLETNKGNIEIELDRESAPDTVENFLSYVNEGFYDGLVFHRVIKGFMIQGGGFTQEGIQKETKQPIKLESDNGLKNLEGTIAMARTSVPDSATSQFFINTVDNDFLNYAIGPGREGYAVFGKVVKGMDVVKSIEQVSTTTKQGMQDWPVEDVVINKAYVKN
ncbi:peptidyl-prolyl cis-trans isomerase [Candidatus Woesearchaeota archaeon]|nr:peptidyl-prolyl cis-trans isomerase [Candidatus Woesearchaeota archaeon]